MLLIHCIIALFCSFAIAQEAPDVRVDINHGAVTGIQNLLTNEAFTLASDGIDIQSTVRLCDAKGQYSESGNEMNGVSLETSIQADGSDVVVQQSGSNQDGGVSGISLGLGPVDAEKVTLLIPGVGGVSLGPDSKVADTTYYYPGAWGTPALILQGANGGILISADDPGTAFLALRVIRLRSSWKVILSTYAEPPWDNRTQCSSAKWRFTAFRGPWTVATAMQREKIQKTFQLTPRAQREPAWAEDIKCIVRVVGTGDFTEPLQALAREVDPTKTLLYVPDWRTNPYDVMYPDYTPTPRAIAFIKAAHELGFRVMAHGNLVGISPFHPRIEEFRDAVERDPATHAEVGWYLDRDVPGQIFCLNPAFSKVRKLLVEAFVESYKQAGFDALHLDFPLITLTDTGPVEGMNAIQGTVKLLRELQAAMPGVPLSTEGISDYMLDVSWAQLGEPFWNNNEMMGRYHPVRSAIFSDFTHNYGHLGIPDQQTDLQAFLSFVEVHDRTGCLPTFSLNLDQGLDLDAPGTQYALRHANFFLKRNPVPDYQTVLQPVAVPGEQLAVPYFAWQFEGGGNLAVVQTSEGRKWIGREKDEDWKELWRIYQGITDINGNEHVRGWLTYSGNHSFGFDPLAIYMPEAGAPDPAAFHISSVSSPVRTTLCGMNAKRDVVQLEPVRSSVLDLTTINPDRSGIIVNGEELPMGKGAAFSLGSFTCGGIARRSIWAHPPWQFPQIEERKFSPDFRPASFGEFKVKLPDTEGMQFRTFMGLRDFNDPKTQSSDGVTFTVKINDTVVYQNDYSKRDWEFVEIDLTPWRNQEIRLMLITDIGPAGGPDCDWACWGEPTIILSNTNILTTIELNQPDQSGTLLVTDITGTRKLETNTPRTDVILPASVIYAREATDVKGAISLLGIPVQSYLSSGAVLTAGGLYGAGTPLGWDDGDTHLPGINGHTPPWGQTHLEWLLRLPTEPLKLTFSSAIRSQGESASFSVLVNGQITWDGGDPGSGKTMSGAVDLSRYAGQTILLSLVTDSMGSNNCDWAVWINPELKLKNSN